MSYEFVTIYLLNWGEMRVAGAYFNPEQNVHLFIYRSDNGEIQENIIVVARFTDARKLRHDRRQRGRGRL